MDKFGFDFDSQRKWGSMLELDFDSQRKRESFTSTSTHGVFGGKWLGHYAFPLHL